MPDLLRRRLVALLATMVASAGARPRGRAQPPASPQSAPEPIAVMSFNIRYGTADDGDNHWTKRRDLLFDVLRAEKPDLIGLQEALRFQIDEILAAVPGYASTGVGRDDGRAAGEMSAILFRADRFHVAGSGTFWFSDTPEVPGSKHWGNRITRICSWARFVDRDGRAFAHYNVHLDHESQPSRERSTALLRRRIGEARRPGEPVVVTGDFNAGEQNAAVHVLVGTPGPRDGASVPPLVDTFRARQPQASEVGTFTAFKIGQTTGDKIDYVLVDADVEILDAGIVRTSRDGRYPSDHFPVTARIRFPIGPAAPRP